MQADEIFDRLASQARQDQGPAVDVADCVMQAIYARQAVVQADGGYTRALAWVAGAALAVCLAVVGLTLPALQVSGDPMSEVFIAALRF